MLARSARMTWIPEMFTATFTGALPSPCQPLASRQASSSTHSPMGTMRPLASAIGMKRSARLRPSRERTTEGAPPRRPRGAWQARRPAGSRGELAALERSSKAALEIEILQHVDAARLAACRNETRSDRLAFAWYMAMSARFEQRVEESSSVIGVDTRCRCCTWSAGDGPSQMNGSEVPSRIALSDFFDLPAFADSTRQDEELVPALPAHHVPRAHAGGFRRSRSRGAGRPRPDGQGNR